MKTTMKLSAAQEKALSYISANGGFGVTVANASAPSSAVAVLERLGLVKTECAECKPRYGHHKVRPPVVYATLTDAGLAFELEATL